MSLPPDPREYFSINYTITKGIQKLQQEKQRICHPRKDYRFQSKITATDPQHSHFVNTY